MKSWFAPGAGEVPMPPFDIPNIPPKVSVPDEVTGPPVNERPVVPPEALTDVTVPRPRDDVEIVPTDPFVPNKSPDKLPTFAVAAVRFPEALTFVVEAFARV